MCQVARPRTHDDALRIRLLDEGGRLLAAEGPPALTTRRLAKQSGTSSSAVYNLFGDKSGLVRAMYAEGFVRLARRFAELQPTADPLGDLIALGRAFRANAVANPHLYDLMFGSPFPDLRHTVSDSRESLSTFQALVDAVQRCMDAGVIARADALDLAMVLFAQVNGLAAMEIKGWLGTLEEADRRWDLALGTAAERYRLA
jgi:AcrR family transcriptional regulator